ncbi:hypothetical protein CHARACLAT_020879 [Characodon lateralis]|uniref:Maturase K n=1 Tax=Characodon lateralis TaxID=208331 RepID=A0ABU7DBE4_9TELE|nr:hypothetical protein [Characodon lateralis]
MPSTPPICALLSRFVGERVCLQLILPLALGELKRIGNPYSLDPSRRLHSLLHTLIKRKKKQIVGDWRVEWGYFYSQRSSMAQTIRPIFEVNYIYFRHLLFRWFHLIFVENAWNFLSTPTSRNSFVLLYATDV